ncbi:MAG: hypothetical protein WC365_07170 [Candidatus Babeliales bacterium]
MKYKSGDKVKIRSDINFEDYYTNRKGVIGFRTFIDSLNELRGKTVEIIHVYEGLESYLTKETDCWIRPIVTLKEDMFEQCTDLQ